MSKHTDPYHFVNRCWGYTFWFMVIGWLVIMWGKEIIRELSK